MTTNHQIIIDLNPLDPGKSDYDSAPIGHCA